MDARIGQLSVTHSVRGIPSYALELWHDGLNKHRLIRDGSQEIVCRKAELQIAEWDERWEIVDARSRETSDKAASKQRAIERTAEAQRELDLLSTLLALTLTMDDAVDWAKLKEKTTFAETMPALGNPPTEPHLPAVPREPQTGDLRYRPELGFLDKVLSSRKKQRVVEKLAVLKADREEWSRQIDEIKQSHSNAQKAHQAEIVRRRDEHASRVGSWEQRKAMFFTQQSARNAIVDGKRSDYLASHSEAIVEYCDLVLSASRYPDYFPQEFDLDYDPGAKVLIVDYALPAPSDLPTLKAVKYIATRDDFDEQRLPESACAKLYDDALYQVVLRTVHELFEADVIGALQTVVFNGIVTSVSRSTGKHVTACVLSLRASRDEFLSINLAQVDPKACFKSLKGVGSSKLHGLSPVPPIMPLRREDGRFVSAYEVANTLDASVNLASMDWEDFEHLIREVFEKEFSSTGGEVKITQASRDGGVDAIAFDPDPIRGGKIVIQAKRYTNTVGVSAVRDLYGTVVNEGATKGVLVTTSDYGPDSYSFAAGKPLVLLSGANLLHMLEKHGHRARIDIREAKSLAGKT